VLIHHLKTRCQKQKRSIVLPESLDDRVLKATDQLVTEGAIKHVYLISSRREVTQQAQALGLNPSSWRDRVIYANDEWPQLSDEVAHAYEAYLKSRGKSLDSQQIAAFAGSPLAQAGHLLATGRTDAALAGCVYATADVIRAALATVGL